MADWTHRKAIGDRHEQHVMHELERRGWTVHPFGQDTYPPAIQAALRLTDSPLRQLPDMIAARGMQVVCIDAKTSLGSADSHRFSVSRKSLVAGLQFTAISVSIPLYYVFGDLRVLTPSEVAFYSGYGHHHPGGSYYLVTTQQAHGFDDVFGTGGLRQAG